jgi:ribokinase
LNQAVSAARSGAKVTLQTTVGNDSLGLELLAALHAEGILLPPSAVRDGPTDEAIIFVLPNGENAIICSTRAAQEADHSAGLAMLSRFGRDDWLVLQGNVSRNVTEDTLLRARDRGIRTIVNPSPILFDYAGLWALIDIVIVNTPEASALTRCQNLDDAAENFLQGGCSTVIITAGSAGAVLRRAGHGSSVVIASPVATGVDTTGAGDTCCGILAAGLDLGMSIESALAWGVQGAAITVSRWGSLSALPARAWKACDPAWPRELRSGYDKCSCSKPLI